MIINVHPTYTRALVPAIPYPTSPLTTPSTTWIAWHIPSTGVLTPTTSLTTEEEAEEIEEADSKLDCDEGDSWGDLASRDTILISELRPEDYASAVSWLQGMGITIIQDNLPYSTPTATMALDIPPHSLW